MTSRLVSLLKLGGSRLFPKRKLRIFQVITPTTPYSSKSTGRRKRSGVLGQGLGFRAFRGRAAQLTRARGRQGRVARFHFEVFKASKSRFCNFLRRKGKGGQGRAGFGFRAFRGRAAHAGPRPGLREGQGAGQAGRRQGAGAGDRGQGRVARFHFEVFKA